MYSGAYDTYLIAIISIHIFYSRVPGMFFNVAVVLQ